MNLIEAREIIIACIKAREPVMLWGAAGVGKTQTVEQIAKAMRYGFRDFRASQMDPVDIRGVPSVEKGQTLWNPPADLFPSKRDGDSVLFFDELNTCLPMVEAGLLGVICERRGLHDGVAIVAAGNGVQHSRLARKLSAPMNDRFFHVDIDPDFEAWKLWAVGTSIAPEIIAFLQWCETRSDKDGKSLSLLHRAPAAGTDDRCFPTPRGWEKVSKVLAHTTPDNVYSVAKARVGEAAAVEFKGFLDVYRSLPKIADIIAKPQSVHVPLEPSAQYAISSALARASTAANLKAIITYLGRLPVEFSVMAISDAVRRDATLKTAPGFTQWQVANQAVTL